MLFSVIAITIAILVGMKWHLVVLICIFLMISDFKHVSLGHLYIFFGQMSVQLLCPFLNWTVLFVEL